MHFCHSVLLFTGIFYQISAVTIRRCVSSGKDSLTIPLQCSPNEDVKVQSLMLGLNKWHTCLNVNHTCIDSPHIPDAIECPRRHYCFYAVKMYSIKCAGYVDFVRITFLCSKKIKTGITESSDSKSLLPNKTHDVVWVPYFESTTSHIPERGVSLIQPGVVAGLVSGTLGLSGLCILAACFYRRKILKEYADIKQKESVQLSHGECHISVTEASLTIPSVNESGYASIISTSHCNSEIMKNYNDSDNESKISTGSRAFSDLNIDSCASMKDAAPSCRGSNRHIRESHPDNMPSLRIKGEFDSFSKNPFNSITKSGVFQNSPCSSWDNVANNASIMIDLYQAQKLLQMTPESSDRIKTDSYVQLHDFTYQQPLFLTDRRSPLCSEV